MRTNELGNTKQVAAPCAMTLQTGGDMEGKHASAEAVWRNEIAEAIHDSVRVHKGAPSYGTIARDLLAKYPVIAAAPGLLDVARRVAGHAKIHAALPVLLLQDIDAAIAKAEGKV